MIAYKLTRNLSKSNLVLLQPKSRSHKANLSLISSPFVSILPSFSMSKYLVLIFDNSLSFESHINNLARKLSKAVGILSKVKVYLNTSALCSLYLALFHCHIQQRWSRGHNVRGQGQGLKKKSEAKTKDRLFEDPPSRGQGQEWSRPRTEDIIFLNYGRQIFHNF